ncbi:MAG: UDP-3-O-acyl-N-acetylglucosamine deacetylase, partial [Pseudomonadota bacterium]
MQTTIKSAVGFVGTGLHTGRPVRLRILPAAAHFGIWFRRTDIVGRDPLIPARYDHVIDSRLCTKIGNADGVSVSTVEHVMAALAGCGIHNAIVELDGPEVPVLDGSAAPFVRAILSRGIVRQDASIRVIEVLREVTVEAGPARAALRPSAGLTMRFSIDFDDQAIGHQARDADLANGHFVRELCDSRTFCRAGDIDAMHAAGLALGGTFDNA